MNEINIFNELKGKECDWKLRLNSFFEKAKKAEGICLFGAGRLGIIAYEILKKNAIKVNYFCDNNKNLWEKEIIDDVVCVSPEYLEKFKKNVLVIITIENYDIYDQLIRMKLTNIFSVYWFKYENRYFFESQDLNMIKEHLVNLGSILEDDESKNIIYKSIKRWLEGDCIYDNINEMKNMYESIKSSSRYFDSKIINVMNSSEIFVDVGAYDGDSIKDFLGVTNSKFDKIIAFELEKSNYDKLKKNIDKYDDSIKKKITLYNKGLYDKNTFVKLASERDNITISMELDKITENEVNISEVVKLDEILKGDRITYMKMDIEGSEMEALIGASETIKRWKPKLRICIYHKPEHYWHIPIYIKELVPEYRIYIRHYSKYTWETVCYAIIE